jgi:hypothetical protein
MKVLLTFPPTGGDRPWEGAAFVQSLTERFSASPDKRGHELVDDAVKADVILYLEPQALRDRPYAELLLKENYIRHYPEKCFSYAYADFFIGFLPGLYVCLPQQHAASPRFASWNYVLGLPNPFAEKMAAESASRKPTLLFSFRGTKSAAVREPIIAHASAWADFARVTEVDGKLFHNVPEEDQRRYVEEILDSQFVLCPRGLGCSSHRLFETMALGRVPVILSDAWVECDGPDWKACSVRVAERDAHRLPEILRAYADRSAEMGRRARQEWETWFAPSIVLPRMFDRLAELVAAQPKTAPNYERLWRSWSFYMPYDLAPPQKLWKNLRNGNLWQKLKNKAVASSKRFAPSKAA